MVAQILRAIIFLLVCSVLMELSLLSSYLLFSWNVNSYVFLYYCLENVPILHGTD